MSCLIHDPNWRPFGNQEIDDAIFACECTYCGAKVGELCVVKKTSTYPPPKASFPHMTRVHAAHQLLRRTRL